MAAGRWLTTKTRRLAVEAAHAEHAWVALVPCLRVLGSRSKTNKAPYPPLLVQQYILQTRRGNNNPTCAHLSPVATTGPDCLGALGRGVLSLLVASYCFAQTRLGPSRPLGHSPKGRQCPTIVSRAFKGVVVSRCLSTSHRPPVVRVGEDGRGQQSLDGARTPIGRVVWLPPFDGIGAVVRTPRWGSGRCELGGGRRVSLSRGSVLQS